MDEFSHITELAYDIKEQYPSLTDYQALDIACKMENNKQFENIASELDSEDSYTTASKILESLEGIKCQISYIGND